MRDCKPGLVQSCSHAVHGGHLNVIASALTPDCCMRSNHWRALSNWPPRSHADIRELYVIVFGAHSSPSSCSCSKAEVPVLGEPELTINCNRDFTKKFGQACSLPGVAPWSRAASKRCTLPHRRRGAHHLSEQAFSLLPLPRRGAGGDDGRVTDAVWVHAWCGP